MSAGCTGGRVRLHVASASTLGTLPLPLLRSLVVAAALALPCAVHADEPPAATEGEERLDTVEVVGEGEDDAPPPEPTVAEEPTGFGTTVELRDFAGQRIDTAELLLQAPGTRVHHGPGSTTLNLRGTSSDQSLVILDGIPLNQSVGGGVDLRTLPPVLLERATVLRGNEGARFGAGALGGAVLLETHRLRDLTLGTLQLSGGSFGTWDLDGTVAGGNDDLQGLAALSLRTSEGDWSTSFDRTPNTPGGAETVTLRNNDERSIGALLKGSAQLGETRVEALANGFLGERGYPGTLHQPQELRRGERRILGALRAEQPVAADATLYGGLELRHDELAIWYPGNPPSSVTVRPLGPGKPWQVENALTARGGGELAPAEWTLLRLDGSVGTDHLAIPDGTSWSRERLALGLQDELYLGTHLTLAAALRWDRVGDLEGLSPRVGAAFRPVKAIEIRANWGRTFRAPSFGELYLEQGLAMPNPDLEPEKGWTVDGGVVVRLPHTLLQIAGFYSRLEEMILYEVLSHGQSKPFNFQDAEIWGGEIEAAVNPWGPLTLTASYSLAQTRNLRDDPRFFDRELPFRPPHRIQGRAALREGDYETFAEASWQSSQFLNRANTVELAGGLLVQAGAGVRLVRNPWELWLSGQIDNAFATRLEDAYGFPQAGRAYTVNLRAATSADDRSH